MNLMLTFRYRRATGKIKLENRLRWNQLTELRRWKLIQLNVVKFTRAITFVNLQQKTIDFWPDC